MAHADVIVASVSARFREASSASTWRANDHDSLVDIMTPIPILTFLYSDLAAVALVAPGTPAYDPLTIDQASAQAVTMMLVVNAASALGPGPLAAWHRMLADAPTDS
jgi:hypothetical protein